MTIAFDVDGTLFDTSNKVRREIVMLLIALFDAGNTIIVWSGGGIDYAKQRIRELELEDFVSEYRPKIKVVGNNVEIAIDDQEVKLGTWNIRV